MVWVPCSSWAVPWWAQVESARQPANFEKVFALKPPQLSVLQRYLSIQDCGAKMQGMSSPCHLHVISFLSILRVFFCLESMPT